MFSPDTLLVVGSIAVLLVVGNVPWRRLAARVRSLPACPAGGSPALIAPPPTIGGVDRSDPYGVVRVFDEILDEWGITPAERHPLIKPILDDLLKRSEAVEPPGAAKP